MKIILSENCESFVGSPCKGYGYAVRKHKKGFYGFRNSKGFIPRDGHIKFIFACALLAHSRCAIADIRVAAKELYDALYEAHYFVAAGQVLRNADNFVKLTYNAGDIINLKTTFGL